MTETTPRGQLSPMQIRRSLTRVRPDRVEQVQGRAYVPAHEIRAELTRTFGPGNWDSKVHNVELIYETEEPSSDGKKIMYRVCYRAAVTLRVRDYRGNPVAEFTEYHAEECAPNPSRGEAHAFALTSVESYALRRAAIGLGDNFGLHLYNNGSLTPIIAGTLALNDKDSPTYMDPEEQGKIGNSEEGDPASPKVPASEGRTASRPRTKPVAGETLPSDEAKPAPVGEHNMDDAFKKPTARAAAAKPQAAAS